MTGEKKGGEGKDALADYMRALNKLHDTEDSSKTCGPVSPAGSAAGRDDAQGTANPPAAPARAVEDTMSQYLKALERAKCKPAKKPAGEPGATAHGSPRTLAALRAARSALEAEPAVAQAHPAEAPAKRSGMLRRGLDRLQSRGDGSKPARKKLAPRRVAAAGNELPEAPLKLERQAPPPKAKAKPNRKSKAGPKIKPARAAPRGVASAAPFNASPISVKIGALLLSLVVGLLLQRLIYHVGEIPYALNDLTVGTAVVLPVLLILFLVSPETRSDWTALLASSAAISVTGGLGIALGASLLHANALEMNETAYPIQLVVHLVILSVLWGPIFLTVTGLLHRMELLKLSDPLET